MPITRADWIRIKMMDRYQEQLEAKARLRTQFGRSVFISYSRFDQDVANEISALLTSMNIDHFLDRKDIDWGEDITQEVKAGLRTCTHTLLVVSPASLKSSWVAYEIGQAAALGKVILPLLTHPSLELPGFIAGLNYKVRLADVRAFFETPDGGTEELASTLSSLLSFFPPDLHTYSYCVEDSSPGRETWRSQAKVPMPGRGGDGYGRITIDATGTLPTLSISYNEKGASYVVHHRSHKISFDEQHNWISVFLRDVNNDGDSSHTSDEIAANSAFWLKLVELIRSHICKAIETPRSDPDVPPEERGKASLQVSQ